MRGRGRQSERERETECERERRREVVERVGKAANLPLLQVDCSRVCQQSFHEQLKEWGGVCQASGYKDNYSTLPSHKQTEQTHNVNLCK